MNSRDDKNLKKIYASIINEAIKKPAASESEHEWTSKETPSAPKSSAPSIDTKKTFGSLKGDLDAINSVFSDLDKQETKSGFRIPEVKLPQASLSKHMNAGIGNFKRYKKGELPQWGRRQVERLTELAYKYKKSFMIYGEAGIGKSDIVREQCEKIAKKIGKRFVDWGKMNDQQRDVIIQNPEHFFVVMEFNMSEQADTTDIKGTPKFELSATEKDKTYSVWVPSQQVDFLRQENADGVLFLDEVLHRSFAKPLLFKLLRERQMGTMPISKKLGIVAAGNTAEYGDYEEVEALHKPVRTRFSLGVGILVANPREWADWAASKGIDPVVIGFALSEPAKTFLIQPDPNLSPDEESKVPGYKPIEDRIGKSPGYPSPRSIVDFSAEYAIMSNLLDEYEKTGDSSILDSPEFRGYSGKDFFKDAVWDSAAAHCGATWADEFITYLKTWGLIDLKTLMADKNLHKTIKTNKDNEFTSSKLSQIGLKLGAIARQVIDDINSGKIKEAHDDAVFLTKAIHHIFISVFKAGHNEHAKNTWQFVINSMKSSIEEETQMNSNTISRLIMEYMKGLKDDEKIEFATAFKGQKSITIDQNDLFKSFK